MGDHAGRFIDDEQGCVFVDNLERQIDGSGGGFEDRLFEHGAEQARAVDFEAFVDGKAVKADLACLESALQAGAADVVNSAAKSLSARVGGVPGGTVYSMTRSGMLGWWGVVVTNSKMIGSLRCGASRCRRVCWGASKPHGTN